MYEEGKEKVGKRDALVKILYTTQKTYYHHVRLGIAYLK